MEFFREIKGIASDFLFSFRILLFLLGVQTAHRLLRQGGGRVAARRFRLHRQPPRPSRRLIVQQLLRILQPTQSLLPIW